MSGQASAAEARDELARLRPDVLRVMAGLVANPSFMNNVANYIEPPHLVQGRGDAVRNAAIADHVAGWALDMVKAVDRACGAEP